MQKSTTQVHTPSKYDNCEYAPNFVFFFFYSIMSCESKGNENEELGEYVCGCACGDA